MALFQWIAELHREDAEPKARQALTELGMHIELEDKSIYATYAQQKPDKLRSIHECVKITISPCSHHGSEYHIAVYSSESMARAKTKCQEVAEKIRVAFPPI